MLAATSLKQPMLVRKLQSFVPTRADPPLPADSASRALAKVYTENVRIVEMVAKTYGFHPIYAALHRSNRTPHRSVRSAHRRRARAGVAGGSRANAYRHRKSFNATLKLTTNHAPTIANDDATAPHPAPCNIVARSALIVAVSGSA
jgi:hypothetical protein